MLPETTYRLKKETGKFFVFWVLGNQCTYHCSYCPKQFHDGSSPYHPSSDVLRTLKELPACHVLFSGGEPTYHPDFEKILDEAPEHVTIGVISNGSRPVSWWERVIPKLYSLVLTFHVEFAKLERFIKVAKVVKHKLHRVNLTMVPARFDECVAVYERLKAEGLPVVPKALVKDFGMMATEVERYSDEQLVWMKAHPEADAAISIIVYDLKNKPIQKTSPTTLLTERETDFRGWMCDSPLENLYVDYSGKMYDSACKQRRLIGTVKDGFKLPTEPVLCKTVFCWCYSDLIAGKTKGPDLLNTLKEDSTMLKVNIVYISNTVVKHFMSGDALTFEQKQALQAVTESAIKRGDIIGNPTRSHEFGGKKLAQSVTFKNKKAYERYQAAQEKAVPGYLTLRAAYYEQNHVAVNEKVTEVE